MKTEAELKARLSELESDKRLTEYREAHPTVNAYLALIQCELRGEACALRWALDLPMRRYHGRDAEEERLCL